MEKLRFAGLFGAVVAVGFSLGLALSPFSRRPADRILAEHDAAKLPAGILDDEQVRELERACRTRAELGLELLQSWPRHARAPELAQERWALLENTFAEHETVLAETARVLASSPPQPLALEASRARAWSGLHSERIEIAQALGFVDDARDRSADGEWCAAMLLFAAEGRTADPRVQRSLCARIHGEHPGARAMERELRTFEKLLAHVDAPLDLEFVDLETARPASIAKWSGAPLLIHVRRSSDWKPLPETELAELEARHRDLGLVALQLIIGRPEAALGRLDRRLIAPDDDPRRSWDVDYGIRKTPLFLVVGGDGRLRGVSQSLAASERWLADLRDPAR